MAPQPCDNNVTSRDLQWLQHILAMLSAGTLACMHMFLAVAAGAAVVARLMQTTAMLGKVETGQFELQYGYESPVKVMCRLPSAKVCVLEIGSSNFKRYSCILPCMDVSVVRRFAQLLMQLPAVMLLESPAAAQRLPGICSNTSQPHTTTHIRLHVVFR